MLYQQMLFSVTFFTWQPFGKREQMMDWRLRNLFWALIRVFLMCFWLGHFTFSPPKRNRHQQPRPKGATLGDWQHCSSLRKLHGFHRHHFSKFPDFPGLILAFTMCLETTGTKSKLKFRFSLRIQVEQIEPLYLSYSIQNDSYQPFRVAIKYIGEVVVVFSLKSQHNYSYNERREDKTINSNHKTVS